MVVNNSKLKKTCWDNYVFSYLTDTGNTESSWRLWVEQQYGTSKFFYCPFINAQDAVHQEGKIFNMMLNKTYNDFLYADKDDDIILTALVTLRNLEYKIKNKGTDININNLDHKAKKLEIGKIHYWGWGLDYLPERMKKDLKISHVMEEDVYSISFSK